MPKLKTHSGAKDRVRISKNGKVRVGHPNMSHFLTKEKRCEETPIERPWHVVKGQCTNYKEAARSINQCE